MRNRLHHDLGFVREVLATADATTVYGAGLKHGLHASTVAKWTRRRATEAAAGNPNWPTDSDIAEWRRDQQENGPARAAASARAYEYRKRVYLQRGGRKVPATGTTRRLRGLSALGWTQPEIAQELGISNARVGHLLQQRFDMVYRETAQKVTDLYDRWSMTTPTDKAPTRRGQVRIHQRARNMARRKGWFPPLAWDEDTIDDPTATPWTPETVHADHAGRPDEKPDRIEDLAWLAESGESLTIAAERLGVTPEAIHTTCRRADRQDLYWRLAARDTNAQRRATAEEALRRQGAA